MLTKWIHLPSFYRVSQQSAARSRPFFSLRSFVLAFALRTKARKGYTASSETQLEAQAHRAMHSPDTCQS